MVDRVPGIGGGKGRLRMAQHGQAGDGVTESAPWLQDLV
jgi:hypothetical protein